MFINDVFFKYTLNFYNNKDRLSSDLNFTEHTDQHEVVFDVNRKSDYCQVRERLQVYTQII